MLVRFDKSSLGVFDQSLRRCILFFVEELGGRVESSLVSSWPFWSPDLGRDSLSHSPTQIQPQIAPTSNRVAYMFFMARSLMDILYLKVTEKIRGQLDHFISFLCACFRVVKL